MNAVSIIGVASAFGLVFLWLLALCAEKGVHPLGRVRQGFRRLPMWERTLILIFLSVWIAFAGTKDGTNGVDQVEGETNAVTQVEGGTNVLGGAVQGRARSPSAPQGTANGESNGQALRRVRRTRPTGMTPITDDDIAHLWRISTTFNVNAFAAPTVNAVTTAAWCDYGGLSDSLRIRSAEWRFPFGTKTATGLTVFESGEFRPNVKTHFFPSPFDAKLSLLPRLNWGMLPNGGESVFWHEQTPSNSLILTWHNALYGRDVNSPTNFQAELFADGRFDYRYPDHTDQYEPVFPFDWDGDGLENSVDPEPLVAGPDAHGTNAEWYNRVCGNVFSAVEGADGMGLAPRANGVNTNAYYFVDVIAESLAPVYFVADGTTDLGNPVVVARAGETNHVPLLIGATYSVSSSVPLQVCAPVQALVQMRAAHERMGLIRWPVPISFVMEDGWTRPSVPEELQRRLAGTFSWSDGCCMMVSGDAMSFHCHGCRCRGCEAIANYSYSGYRLVCSGPSCGCTGDSGEGVESPYVDTPSGARLSVRFSRQALLFENAYEDMPGVTVARRSSPVTLTVVASGGTKGGSLSFSTRNFERLFPAAGDVLPTGPVPLAAGSDVSYSCTYEALAPSNAEDDISLTVRFEETGIPPLRLDCTVRLTAIGLTLTADKRAPENACPHRHGYGVRELVKAEQRPASPLVEWRAPDWIVTNGLPASLVCPLVATNRGGIVKACLGDAEYTFDVSVYNPTGVFSRVGEAEWFYRPRIPGWEIPLGMPGTGMKVPVYVGPMDVSFEGIAIAELICNTGSHSGYFNDVFFSGGWCHSHENGAGFYYPVKPGNHWFSDEPNIVLGKYAPRPVSNGTISWDIPIGWNEIKTARGAKCVREIPSDNIKQVMTIDADGTMTLSKFGQWTSRTTNDCRRVNGIIVKRGEE